MPASLFVFSILSIYVPGTIYMGILHGIYFSNNYINTNYHLNNYCEIVDGHSYNFIGYSSINKRDDSTNFVWNVSFITNDNNTLYGDACSSYYSNNNLLTKWNGIEYPYQQSEDLNNLFVYQCMSCQQPKCYENYYVDKLNCLISNKPTHAGRYNIIFGSHPYFPTDQYNATIVCTILFMALVFSFAITEIFIGINKLCDSRDFNIAIYINKKLVVILRLSNYLNLVSVIYFIVSKGNIFQIFSSNTNEILLFSYYFLTVTLTLYVVTTMIVFYYNAITSEYSAVRDSYMWRNSLIPFVGIYYYCVSDTLLKIKSSVASMKLTPIIFISNYLPQTILLLTYYFKEYYKLYYDNILSDIGWMIYMLTTCIIFVVFLIIKCSLIRSSIIISFNNNESKDNIELA